MYKFELARTSPLLVERLYTTQPAVHMVLVYTVLLIVLLLNLVLSCTKFSRTNLVDRGDGTKI